MKRFLLAGLVAACTLMAQPNPGTGSIEGPVLNSLTNTPVRKATVILTAPQIRLVSDTDADGRFQFTALPPGSYKLSASHSGFLDHSARRPILLSQSDHVADAEVRLPPQAVIAGHVLDEDGDPVNSARVMIFKQVYRDSRKQWERLNIASLSSEAGEYRFPNLTPGRYVVRADNQQPMVNNRYGDHDLADKMVYVPAYYPNAASEEAALPLEVGMGAEILGVDIHLFKRALPHRFRVRGKVTGVQPDARISISLLLYSADGGEGFATAESPGYAFETSVPPGRYTIFAHVPSGPEAYGMGAVTVTENINDVVITMNPPPDVTGRISLAEDGGKVKLQGVSVTLTPLPTGPNSVADVRSDASGKLVFAKPTAPGHYAIDVKARSIPDGCFVQKVKLGAQEVSLDDFEILTSAQLEIVLSNTAGLIAGTVAGGDGKPFPNSSVTLIPTDGKSQPSRQFADDQGNFKFTALRPGKYKLFAWEEIDDGLWQDPEFQKKYEDRATEITVGPSETRKVQLRLIAAVEM